MSNNQFIDEVYENMDDLSKIVEPFESLLNNDISMFPDEIELTGDDMRTVITYSGSWSEHAFGTVANIARRMALKHNLPDLAKELDGKYGFANKMFDIVLEKDEDSIGVYYDSVNNLIKGGKVFLKKKIIALDDQAIESDMIAMVGNAFYAQFSWTADRNKKRLNELCDLFNATEARKARGWTEKLNKYVMHLQELVKDRKLPIKDIELFKRFLNWNVIYIKNGNLPAMANVTRLKIMLKSGLPIYSMKEDDT